MNYEPNEYTIRAKMTRKGALFASDEVAWLLKEIERLQQQHNETRVPSAWTEFGDGHDYSRTGKHLPEQCRYCLREHIAKLTAVTGGQLDAGSM